MVIELNCIVVCANGNERNGNDMVGSVIIIEIAALHAQKQTTPSQPFIINTIINTLSSTFSQPIRLRLNDKKY